jgi:hypothetical protein
MLARGFRVEGQSRRRGPDRWLVIAFGVVVAILAFDAAGISANALLSNSYRPERAVTDYFAAQSGGDVSAMLSNATFQSGSDPVFFNRSAIFAMMQLPQNRDVHNVHIISAQSVDPSSAIVNLSMTWAGNDHRQAYTVREDSSRVHEMIYHSWRIVIPFVTIRLVLPNQSGPISVDGINTASLDASTIQVIEGYHQVTMSSNLLYDSTTRLVDGVHDAGVLGFPFAVGSTAYRQSARAVIVAFEMCDPAKRSDCLNHTYSAGPGYQFTWGDLPGYGRVVGTTYRITLADDPTSYMNLAVPADPGILDAFGDCAVTMTVDGTTKYDFDGGWTATLTWLGPGFIANLTYVNCFFEGGSPGVTT